MNYFILYILLANAFIMLCYLTHNADKAKSERIQDVLFAEGDVAVLLLKQRQGVMILTMTILSFLFLGNKETVFLAFMINEPWQILLPLLSLTAITLILMSSKTPLTLAHKTNERLNSRQLSQFFFGRICFIILYEFFFRGLLLFSIAAATGIYISVMINLLLYCFIHRHFTKTEIAGVAIFGTIQCIMTVVNHSVWPAVLLHLSITLAVEMKLLFHKNKQLNLTTA
ncbi:MAG: CPBP family intramembrane glutamic endopeptidase [Ferruginibacter sp.]